MEKSELLSFEKLIEKGVVRAWAKKIRA
jgi:hypothetical protein